ncbi:Teichuronic acid biosynthesis protein TuaB [compost metagenome]
MENLKKGTTQGLKWSAIERILTQGVQLAITLILAKMLGPTAFGLVGMLAIFIAIANVFVDSGFSSALIRKPECTQSDFVTAFYYNILVSLSCYLVLYISAPWVAEFYQQSQLQSLLRILGCVVLINASTLIPRVQLTINMDFKTQAKISICSAVTSGMVALTLAYYGYGVWALVAQTLLNALVMAIIFNVVVPWRPKGGISQESLDYLFGFGSKLLLSGLLDTIYNNIYQIIIGKKFSPAAVGQFTQANQLASVPAITMTSIIQRVTYPMFSKLQSQSKPMDDTYRLTLKLAALVIFPLIMGLAIIAEPLLIWGLGEEWKIAANLLTVLCVGCMLYPIHAINLNILQVKGRSDLCLKLEVIKKSIGISILLITIPLGVLAMCAGLAINSYLALIFNTYYTAKLTSISQRQQCQDLLPFWLAVMCAATLAYVIGLSFHHTIWLQVIITLSVAVVSYVSYLIIAQRPLLQHIKATLRD